MNSEGGESSSSVVSGGEGGSFSIQKLNTFDKKKTSGKNYGCEWKEEDIDGIYTRNAASTETA